MRARLPLSAINSMMKSSKVRTPIGKEMKATRTTSWGPRYDVRLTVIGVMEEKGDAMDTEGWDERFIIPLTTFQQRFTGRKEVERIRVEAASLDEVEIAKEEAKHILGRMHNNSGEEYQYWTAQEELATAEKNREYDEIFNGRDRADCAFCGRNRYHEYHAGLSHRTNKGDRSAQGTWGKAARHLDAVSDRGVGLEHNRRYLRRSSRYFSRER